MKNTIIEFNNPIAWVEDKEIPYTYMVFPSGEQHIRIGVYCTHGIFSNGVEDILKHCNKIITTDSMNDYKEEDLINDN